MLKLEKLVLEKKHFRKLLHLNLGHYITEVRIKNFLRKDRLLHCLVTAVPFREPSVFLTESKTQMEEN